MRVWSTLPVNGSMCCMHTHMGKGRASRGLPCEQQRGAKGLLTTALQTMQCQGGVVVVVRISHPRSYSLYQWVHACMLSAFACSGVRC